MQLAEPTVISMHTPYNEQKYVILPDELKRLRSLKLINVPCYVYLALRMTYKQSSPSINVPKFAEDWDITEADCRAAIAALHKKHCLEPVHQQLELELFSTEEAIANKEADKEAEKAERLAG